VAYWPRLSNRTLHTLVQVVRPKRLRRPAIVCTTWAFPCLRCPGHTPKRQRLFFRPCHQHWVRCPLAGTSDCWAVSTADTGWKVPWSRPPGRPSPSGTWNRFGASSLQPSYCSPTVCAPNGSRCVFLWQKNDYYKEAVNGNLYCIILVCKISGTIVQWIMIIYIKVTTWWRVVTKQWIQQNNNKSIQLREGRIFVPVGIILNVYIT